MKLVLDPDRSSVRLRTFAEGLFSRLAHDLELSCRGLSGDAERADDGAGSAVVEAPIGKIEVAGTLKRGRVDPAGLSSAERADCLEKMRRDVFHVADGTVRVEAELVGVRAPSEARGRASGAARVRVVPPKGKQVERSVTTTIETEGTTVRASGTFELSLAAIGSDTVKGPMNAFRVKDGVEVLFDIVFVPAP